MDSRAIGPKDPHVLTSRTRDNVSLHGEKDFADVIEARDGEACPGLSPWVPGNHKGPCQGKEGGGQGQMQRDPR